MPNVVEKCPKTVVAALHATRVCGYGHPIHDAEALLLALDTVMLRVAIRAAGTEWVPGAFAVAPVPEVATAPSVGGNSSVSTVVTDPTSVRPVANQQALQALADTFNVPDTTAGESSACLPG